LSDHKIPDENKILMKETEEITKNNNNLNLVFAFNYGSHNEIHSAVMELHNNNLEKVLSLEEITDSFYSYFQYSRYSISRSITSNCW
jgi:undecaprenyl diphosphate synthase